MPNPSANAITRDILLGISERFHGRIVAWRNNTGRARRDTARGIRMIQFGLPGQADISGILPSGRRLEIEVKAGDDRQTTKQKAFQEMIEGHGGVYLIARDSNQCLWELANILDGTLTTGTRI